MFDLQALAFQADITRIATMMIAREGSTRTYPEIGVADPHHPLTHHRNNPEWIEKVTQINEFHMGLFAEVHPEARQHARGRRHAARPLDDRLRQRHRATATGTRTSTCRSCWSATAAARSPRAGTSATPRTRR